jgi:vitamin B12 transporter
MEAEMNLLFLLAAAAQQPEVPADEAQGSEEIVVTASLNPIPLAEAPLSVTKFDAQQIEALAPLFAADLLRLSPGVSVSVSGAQGAQTQLRIRGAEANHTLLFIDGIAFNDLASGNEPRFETLTAEGLGGIELIRGPQSALWGSEALGGVVAVSTPDPLGRRRATAMGEYGSRDFARLSGALASGGERGGLSATAAFARSDGIDILGGGEGDRDGFENVTVSLKGLVRPADRLEVGAVGRYLRHDFMFDGTDEFFRRADTAEASVAETYAVRGWLGYGRNPESPWALKIDVQHLDSENRNRDDAVRTNDSFGRRTRFAIQGAHRFSMGRIRNELIGAAEREDEHFGTRDLLFGGASDRDLQRGRTAFVGEWRAVWSDRLITDLAIRHDDFSRFEDKTAVRANAVLNVTSTVAVVASYGDGIAQPTFVDLFGFGPGSGFIGNPDLRPERSRGLEGGFRWTGRTASIEAVAFSNDLRDEILEDFSAFPNYTVVNAPGKSRRRGVELSAQWRPVDGLSLGGGYSYIDTRERGGEGVDTLREVRRPRHGGSLYGTWNGRRLTVGASMAYVGKRTDRDFDFFPAPLMRLDDYVLASGRFAYRVTRRLEAFARIENAFDADYRDVVGYDTPGRTVYAGVRVRLDP